MSRGFTRRLTWRLRWRLQTLSMILQSCNPLMQMAVTCRTCFETRIYTATWIWRLHARPTPWCQDSIKMDLIKVKCDLHSADVEIDGGADVYNDRMNKSLSIKFKEFIYWLPALSSITVLLLAVSLGLVASGLFVSLFVCLSFCLCVCRSVLSFVA